MYQMSKSKWKRLITSIDIFLSIQFQVLTLMMKPELISKFSLRILIVVRGRKKYTVISHVLLTLITYNSFSMQ